MLVEKKNTYTLISTSEKSVKVFYDNFLKEVDTLKNDHLIIDLSQIKGMKKEDFLLFLDIAQQKIENGTSFAIINNEANADDFPENFNVVPTLTEAEDILEMEAIERALGF